MQFIPRELVPAVSVLQLFCSSPKATLRFAAVRTLNQVTWRESKGPKYYQDILNPEHHLVTDLLTGLDVAPGGGDCVQPGPGEPDHGLEPLDRHARHHHAPQDRRRVIGRPTHEAGTFFLDLSSIM